MNDNYYDESTPSLRVVGDNLLILEAEVEKLEHEAGRLFRQLSHITAKQRIATAALKKLLIHANGGVYTEPCPVGHFPELNHPDEI